MEPYVALDASTPCSTTMGASCVSSASATGGTVVCARGTVSVVAGAGADKDNRAMGCWRRHVRHNTRFMGFCGRLEVAPAEPKKPYDLLVNNIGEANAHR